MKKILIVEDEKEIRNILKVYLLTAGYEVAEAADGEEAMRIFYEKPFDLVVLDIMLPKKDGWSICREIKEYSSVPVIIITARDNENDEVFGFEIGADDYITKPFSNKVFLARVNDSTLSTASSLLPAFHSLTGSPILASPTSLAIAGIPPSVLKISAIAAAAVL